MQNELKQKTKQYALFAHDHDVSFFRLNHVYFQFFPLPSKQYEARVILTQNLDIKKSFDWSMIKRNISILHMCYKVINKQTVYYNVMY